MINKYLGVSLISASLAIAGCSSNDDDATPIVVPPDVEVPDTGGPIDPPETGLVEVPQDYIPSDGVTLSLVETLTNRGNFTMILAAVDAAGLSDALNGDGPLTVFAPTDDVFAALPDGALPTEPEALADLISNHVITGALNGALVGASVGSSVATLGAEQAISQNGATLMFGGVEITETDIETTNGIIHSIGGIIGVSGDGDATPPPDGGPGAGGPDGDNPFIGPAAAISAGLTDFGNLYEASGLGGALDENPWVVFLPNNDAIPDSALGLDQAAAFDILNDHIITDASINAASTPADLLALGSTMSNSGLVTYTFGGTPDALTINGFAATPFPVDGINAVLYEIDGLLAP